MNFDRKENGKCSFKINRVWEKKVGIRKVGEQHELNRLPLEKNENSLPLLNHLGLPGCVLHEATTQSVAGSLSYGATEVIKKGTCPPTAQSLKTKITVPHSLSQTWCFSLCSMYSGFILPGEWHVRGDSSNWEPISGRTLNSSTLSHAYGSHIFCSEAQVICWTQHFQLGFWCYRLSESWLKWWNRNSERLSGLWRQQD